jgi:hypothetical protein
MEDSVGGGGEQISISSKNGGRGFRAEFSSAQMWKQVCSKQHMPALHKKKYLIM